MIAIRQMAVDELSKIVEIDMTEDGDTVYEQAGGELTERQEEWHRPTRSAETWGDYIRSWMTFLPDNGIALGAFDGDRLAGIAVLRYRLDGPMAQLAALFVSRDYRRQGVATQLTRDVFRLAREHGASSIYVSATPSRSAVGFYTRVGFRPTGQVNKQLFELEPEDIHMAAHL